MTGTSARPEPGSLSACRTLRPAPATGPHARAGVTAVARRERRCVRAAFDVTSQTLSLVNNKHFTPSVSYQDNNCPFLTPHHSVPLIIVLLIPAPSYPSHSRHQHHDTRRYNSARSTPLSPLGLNSAQTLVFDHLAIMVGLTLPIQNSYQPVSLSSPLPAPMSSKQTSELPEKLTEAQFQPIIDEMIGSAGSVLSQHLPGRKFSGILRRHPI